MGSEERKCGAVHIDDDMRVQYNCILSKGHDGPHHDYGTQYGCNPHTGEKLQHNWWMRWTDDVPRGD